MHGDTPKMEDAAQARCTRIVQKACTEICKKLPPEYQATVGMRCQGAGGDTMRFVVFCCDTIGDPSWEHWASAPRGAWTIDAVALADMLPVGTVVHARTASSGATYLELAVPSGATPNRGNTEHLRAPGVDDSYGPEHKVRTIERLEHAISVMVGPSDVFSVTRDDNRQRPHTISYTVQSANDICISAWLTCLESYLGPTVDLSVLLPRDATSAEGNIVYTISCHANAAAPPPDIAVPGPPPAPKGRMWRATKAVGAAGALLGTTVLSAAAMCVTDPTMAGEMCYRVLF